MPVVEEREPLALKMEVQEFLREKKEFPMAGGGCFQEEAEPVLEKRLHSPKTPREERSRNLS
jgi:hypothetical protein